MALLAKAGTFTTITSAAAQAITGVGFTPKAIVFFGSAHTAAGFAAGSSGHYGFTDGTSSYSMAWASDDNANPSNAGKRVAAKCICMATGGTPTSDADADLTSFDADGFTITWTDAPASAYVVNYLALGGTTLTNVKVAEYTGPAATGSFAVTGVGFQSDAVIAFSAYHNANAPATAVNLAPNFSFFTPTQTASNSFRDSDNVTTTASTVEQSGAQMWSQVSNLIATLTSMDADGWTANYTTAGASRRGYYLALKGGVYQAGVDTQPTSAITKDTATAGMLPRALLVASTNRTALSGSSNTEGKHSLGVSDGATNAASWVEGVDARNTTTIGTNTNRASSQTKALLMATSDATTNAEAAITTSAGKFTADWTTADATAREFIYLAIGELVSLVYDPTLPTRYHL